MNYFPWHIGDYAAHTGHLEPMEDLIYRRLLDAYYLREGALPADIQTTAKLIRLRSMAADVEAVLNEFFELTENGWMHSRCDEEIAKMHDKQAKARASAQASVNSRRAKAQRPLDQDEAAAERSLASILTDVELPTPTPTPTPTPKINTSPDLLSESEPVSEFSIPLVDGTDYLVTQRLLTEWEAAYPAVDVPQELREMRTWSMANRAQRKTRNGVERFAVKWLGKAQDTPNRNLGRRQAGGADWTGSAT